MSDRIDLTSVAEDLEFLDDIAIEIELNGWSGIGVDGNTYVTNVVLVDRCLWSSEEDDRAFSEEENEYTETVVDCVLRALDAKVKFYAELSKRAKEYLKKED